MSLSTILDPVFFDTIACGLVQCFLAAAGSDQEAVRNAARNLLQSYNVQTDEELRIAAQIGTFSLGALQILAKSMDSALPLNAVLHLRGSANAQQGSANQCQRTLEKIRAERRAVASDTQPTTYQPADAITVPERTEAAVMQRMSMSAASRVETTLLCQQRRAMNRAVEKAQRKQDEQARREAMRIMRTQTSPFAGAKAVPPQLKGADRPIAA